MQYIRMHTAEPPRWVTGGIHPTPLPNLSSVCSVHPYKLARTSFLFWGVFSSIVLSVCHQLSFGYKDKHNMLKDKQVEIQSGPLLVLQKSLELCSRKRKFTTAPPNWFFFRKNVTPIFFRKQDHRVYNWFQCKLIFLLF